jgi:hypothetical protein
MRISIGQLSGAIAKEGRMGRRPTEISLPIRKLAPGQGFTDPDFDFGR